MVFQFTPLFNQKIMESCQQLQNAKNSRINSHAHHLASHSVMYLTLRFLFHSGPPHHLPPTRGLPKSTGAGCFPKAKGERGRKPVHNCNHHPETAREISREMQQDKRECGLVRSVVQGAAFPFSRALVGMRLPLPSPSAP